MCIRIPIFFRIGVSTCIMYVFVYVYVCMYLYRHNLSCHIALHTRSQMQHRHLRLRRVHKKFYGSLRWQVRWRALDCAWTCVLACINLWTMKDVCSIWCNIVQFGAVWCSVLQCFAVCCSTRRGSTYATRCQLQLRYTRADPRADSRQYRPIHVKRNP